MKLEILKQVAEHLAEVEAIRKELVSIKWENKLDAIEFLTGEKPYQNQNVQIKKGYIAQNELTNKVIYKFEFILEVE